MADAIAFDATNPLARIESMMKGELEPAREAQSGALAQLKQAHSTPSEEGDYAGRWGAMASGFAAPAESFGMSLANAGGKYGAELQRQFAAQQLNKQKAADLEFQDASKRLTALESKYMGALSGATKNKSSLPQKVSLGNGKWGWMDPMNPNAGIQPMAENDAADYDRYYDMGFKAAAARGMEDPGSYAQQFAAERVKTRPTPTVMQQGVPTKPFPLESEVAPKVELTPDADKTGLAKMLEADEKRAVEAGDYARATELQKVRQQMLKATPGAIPQAPTAEQVQPAAAPTRPVLGDMRPDVKRKEEYAGEQGKALAKERQALAAAEGASATMEGQLNLLKKLYESNTDISQGAGASTLKNIKSNLKTLGVDVGPSAALEDVIQATASNMALHMRTAGGDNLLPGAMSNYEDQILQGMAPGLSQTSEGRKMLIEFMLDVTKSNKRIAQEATKYEGQNKQLDAGWYKRRERVMKEEQARLAQRRNEIMSKFGGVQ